MTVAQHDHSLTVMAPTEASCANEASYANEALCATEASFGAVTVKERSFNPTRRVAVLV